MSIPLMTQEDADAAATKFGAQRLTQEKCTAFDGDTNCGCVIYRDDTDDGLPREGSRSVKVKYGEYRDVGAAFNILGVPSWHDAVDAILIAPYTVVIMYNEGDFRGTPLLFINRTPYCARNGKRFTTMGYHDSVDSMKVSRLKPTNKDAMKMCGMPDSFEQGPYKSASDLCKVTVPTDYCTVEKKISDPACQVWCKSHTEQCDRVVQDFCNVPANRANVYCSCYNSPTLAISKYALPHVLDATCAASGYVNTTWKNSNPALNILDCSTQLKLNADTSYVRSNTFQVQQSCMLNADGGIKTNTTTEPTQTSIPTSASDPDSPTVPQEPDATDAGPASSEKKRGLTTPQLLIILAVVAVIVAGATFAFAPKKNNGGNAR